MDPIHYDKIVDKLLQFRGKMPKNGQLADKRSQWTCELMRNQLDDFVLLIEEFARLDASGLIK